MRYIIIILLLFSLAACEYPKHTTVINTSCGDRIVQSNDLDSHKNKVIKEFRTLIKQNCKFKKIKHYHE
jgi:hypothetical protein